MLEKLQIKKKIAKIYAIYFAKTRKGRGQGPHGDLIKNNIYMGKNINLHEKYIYNFRSIKPLKI